LKGKPNHSNKCYQTLPPRLQLYRKQIIRAEYVSDLSNVKLLALFLSKMKQTLFSGLLLTLFYSVLPAEIVQDGAVEAELIAEVQSIKPGQPFSVGLRLKHAPNWYTYHFNPGDNGLGTILEWNLPPGFKTEKIKWPKPKTLTHAGKTDYIHEDEILLVIQLTPPQILTKEIIELKAQAHWISCSKKEKVCVPGKVNVSLTLPVTQTDSPVKLNSKWKTHFEKTREDFALEQTMPLLSLKIIILAFVGGLILNMMPCVFPVLGIKIMGFVNQATKTTHKATIHGLVFTAGVLISFWTLAGIIIFLRAGGDALGWGFQLQYPSFVFILTLVFFMFALNLTGLFEIGGTALRIGSFLIKKTSYSGSFLSGILATTIATPCTAPFLASALGAALGLAPLQSLFLFTVIALGFSAPTLVLSALPALIKALPKPGPWMESFKCIMAFPLFATTGYLIWVLGGQVGEYGLLFVLLSLVLVSMGAWIYGRWATTKKTRRIAQVFSLGFILGAVWLGYPKTNNDHLLWQQWSPELVRAIRKEGKPVYVDFTARWCATCQTNKALVLSSQKLLNAFKEKEVILIKADWTKKNPLIAKALTEFGRSAVPLNLIYLPGKQAPIVLPVILTPEIVLDVLKDIE
jgi:thiol:disulfide interchange protein